MTENQTNFIKHCIQKRISYQNVMRIMGFEKIDKVEMVNFYINSVRDPILKDYYKLSCADFEKKYRIYKIISIVRDLGLPSKIDIKTAYNDDNNFRNVLKYKEYFERHLPQSDIAKILNVSYSTVGRYKRLYNLYKDII